MVQKGQVGDVLKVSHMLASDRLHIPIWMSMWISLLCFTGSLHREKISLGFYPNCYILEEDIERNDSWLISQLHLLPSFPWTQLGFCYKYQFRKVSIGLAMLHIAPFPLSFPALEPLPCSSGPHTHREVQNLTHMWPPLWGPLNLCHPPKAELSPRTLVWNWVHFDHRASEKKTIIPSATEQSFNKSIYLFQNQKGSPSLFFHYKSWSFFSLGLQNLVRGQH